MQETRWEGPINKPACSLMCHFLQINSVSNCSSFWLLSPGARLKFLAEKSLTAAEYYQRKVSFVPCFLFFYSL